ncbi:DNA polymerase III subunit gamma/tau C-terminal domain-containing protein [Escherichia coli]
MSAFALLSAAFEQPRAQQKLAEALSTLKGSTVELTIVEDDNPRCVRRWSGVRRYTKKNLRRRASPLLRIIILDLRRFFDAELDEEIIRPI